MNDNNEPVKDNIGLIEEAAEASGDNVRRFKDLGLNATDSLGQSARYAVGAASMCWEFPERAGVFKSEVALDIATQLEQDISRRIALVVGALSDLISDSMKEKRPLSEEEWQAFLEQMLDVDPPNTMAEWLFWRFGRLEANANGEKWEELHPDQQSYWVHEAAAVERAVMRGGFKHREPGDV